MQNVERGSKSSKKTGKNVRGKPLSIFFFHLFFLRIAGVAQAIMLWHMLLFGDAFGPAYAIFWCFCILLFFWGGGVKLQKMISTGNYAIIYGRFRRSQQCCVQRMCVQQYVCVYAKYTLCGYSSTTQKHKPHYTLCVDTAVRPRNIPRNINRMTGCCWGVIN